MNTIKASVFIITKNEESNIKRVIASCSNFDEVLVVDSGSDDKTVDYARSLGATVIFNEWQGYAKQKEFAMSQCQNEWVLNLDADEELTPELIGKISEVVKENKYDFVRCYRNDLFLGKFFNSIVHKPNNHRIFRKSSAKYRLSDLVHEGPDFEGRELKISEYFNHYGYNNIEALSKKYELYSSLKAREKYDKGKKYSTVKILLIAPLTFIKVFFFQRYFLAGIRGYIFSKLQAQYALLKEAKLYEKHINKKKNHE